jgi:hypothetical protein
MNQMRGFLIERGITMCKGPCHLAAQLQIIFGEGHGSLSGRMQGLLLELKHEWDELERRIEEASAELQRIAKQDDACSRLMEIPGVGPLVSTALVASVGNAIAFRKGRDLAAWLGLVPRQHSTGGRPKLLGISKRGNEYLRRMLLHGARSVMMQTERNPSALGIWITDLSKRKHHNVTAVALANKMARIAWAMLTRGSHYSAPELTAAAGGLEKPPAERAWKSEHDFHFPNPPAATMFTPFGFARQINVCVNGQNRRCSSLSGNANFLSSTVFVDQRRADSIMARSSSPQIGRIHLRRPNHPRQ